VLLVVVVAVAAALLWIRRGSQAHPVRARATQPAPLDVGRFHAQEAARLGRAGDLAARPASAGGGVPTGSGSGSAARRWLQQGLGALPHAGKDLIVPCTLGPADLCARLAPLVERCDAGDADDCLAVGQLLADTPPRPLIANVFFAQACRIGDAAGCERLDQIGSGADPGVPCEQDPFACGWRAYRTHDEALLDEACALGMADACAMNAFLAGDDRETERMYLASACQLGNPMACAELGYRVSPACVTTAEHVCFEPRDAAQAKAALDIACAAGWGGPGCKPP
jgi:hypothetical protein